MHRPLLLISTPRSGSDWFADRCLRWQAPGYFREYFNPVTNFARSAVLRLAFGSEVDWQNLAVPWEYQADLCEYVYQATWVLDGYRHAKENYAAFKVGFLRRHFDCFALIGHRRQIFPGVSDPHSTAFWWGRYFQSLEFNRELLDDEDAKLVDHALAAPLDLRRKMVAAQVIVTCRTARECLRYGVPILEYRRLIAPSSTSEVVEHLRDKVPAPLMDDGLADRVVATRRADDQADRYDAWGVEDFAQGLIELIPPELKPYF